VARGSKLPAIGENSRLIQTTVCMSNLLIREARPDDAPVLLAAEKETARTPGLLVSRPHELTLQAFEQKIAELAQRGRYIVAEEDGRIAGHALLDPMPLEAISHVFRLTIGSSRIYRPGHWHRALAGFNGMGEVLTQGAQNRTSGAGAKPACRSFLLQVRIFRRRPIAKAYMFTGRQFHRRSGDGLVPGTTGRPTVTV
jgi:hypothetical protein